MAIFIFLLIALFCFASFANTMNFDKSWRFELYYQDFVCGAAFFSLFFGISEPSFFSNLFVTNIFEGAKALLSGVLFNIGSYLFIAAISIAGMTMAFILGIGVALILSTLLSYFLLPCQNALFLFWGIIFIITALSFVIAAYKKSSREINLTKKGITVSIFCGVLLSLFFPLVSESVLQKGPLSPYTAVFLFSLGLLLCNLFFGTLMMKKPLIGLPLKWQDYFRGSLRRHLWGLIGGSLWCLGLIFIAIVCRKGFFSYAFVFSQGAVLLAAIFGVFIWNEFKEGKRVHRYLGLTFFFYICGLFLIGFAKYL